MNREAKIYVAGHRGLVGSAIVRALDRDGYTNLLLRSHAELDLTDQTAVGRFFADERPQYVFLAAAKVGGILANSKYPAEFIFQNLQMQSNVVESAYRVGVERLLFLGSSCIYPKFAAQPIREDSLLSGALEPTNQTLCRGEDRGNRDVLGVQPPVWHAVFGGHADQSLRSWR